MIKVDNKKSFKKLIMTNVIRIKANVDVNQEFDYDVDVNYEK